MALNKNPGIMTMPKTERDWTKFVNDLNEAVSLDANSELLAEAESLAFFIED
jgi:hypothetical protein